MYGLNLSLLGAIGFLVPALLQVSSVGAQLTWRDTRFLFAFGDSYTSDGFDVTAGVNSPSSGPTSSNGPTWVQYLGRTYNSTNTRVFNLASGGATIDAALVPPSRSAASSLVDQVSLFREHLSQRPSGADWRSDNSLFAVWIGAGDIGNTFSWTNVTQTQFYTTLMNRLNSQLEQLYDLGGRSFLLLTVPPINRSPYFIQRNPSSTNSSVTTRLSSLIENYNNKLGATVNRFRTQHSDLDLLEVFDTAPVFNSLLDNAEVLGYVNITGWCRAYENGTGGRNVHTGGCAPVSSYFWLDGLHPLWTVHNALARAISTVLSS
ncbi:hypothetical protein AX16_006682 [Volvariella volvacea WC 439]|nr:hypothetical protein AX16_006682 [Volvariella volvacea WC 439]